LRSSRYDFTGNFGVTDSNWTNFSSENFTTVEGFASSDSIVDTFKVDELELEISQMLWE